MFDPDKSCERFDELVAEIYKISTHLPASKRDKLYNIVTELRSEYMILNSNYITDEIKLIFRGRK